VTVTIRFLVESDAPALRALRLSALLDTPDAFLSSYEHEAAQPDEVTAERLRKHDRESTGVLGAFEAGVLVGTVGMWRETLRKAVHRANIGAVYVRPEARNRGVGRLLVDSAVERLRLAGVEQVHLWVSTTSTAARRLYEKVGFRVVGCVEGVKRANARGAPPREPLSSIVASFWMTNSPRAPNRAWAAAAA
jgi:ribosomal protein S18 acetylase RimI-like enzyme